MGRGGELRSLALRGAGASVFGKTATLCLQFISAMVLARLLVPSDFGLVAMVTTFSLLLVSFGLNGTTEAIIQREQLDRFLASNLFWINVGAGLLLTIGFAASGSLLAWFFRDPLVARVAVAVSPSILVANAGYLHLALLKRTMRFGAVSLNQVYSRLIAVAVSIFLAWLDWGYWALVAGVVAQPLSLTIGAWVLCPWLPSLPTRKTGTRSMAVFSANVYSIFSINYFARNVDNLLVGWRFNAVALGFYKKAYDLFALPSGQVVAPLSDVALATLSRLRDDSAQYTRYLVNSLAVVSFVGMAIGAGLTLTGKDVVRLVLGARWAESGKIFMLFGPGIGVMLLYNCYSWIHLSIGKPDRWLRWTFIEAGVTALLFVIALPWGPAGIAAAWSVSYWILLIPAFWYAGRPLGLGVSALVVPMWRYAVASLLAGCATAALVRNTPLWGTPPSAKAALAGILTLSGLFLMLYLSIVIALHRGCAPVRQLARLLRELSPTRKPTTPATQSV